MALALTQMVGGVKVPLHQRLISLKFVLYALHLLLQLSDPTPVCSGSFLVGC